MTPCGDRIGAVGNCLEFQNPDTEQGSTHPLADAPLSAGSGEEISICNWHIVLQL